MNELIKITEKNGKRIVSAKELHQYVDMLTRFDIWIMRMLEYGFIENVDYQCLIKSVPMPNGGTKQAIEDYALTLDCAKEIAMLQRNEKGKQARQYFIEMEKIAFQSTNVLPKDYLSALKALVASEEAKQLAETHIKELTPKAEVFDNISNATNLLSMNDAAKSLNLGFGRNKLFEALRNKGVLRTNNTPYQTYIEQGYFEVKITTGSTFAVNYAQTYVTGKGLTWLSKMFNVKKSA